MMGISYFAMSQLLAAAQRPPALKAIFPYDFSTDLYRHIMYHGGLPNTDFDALYVGVNGDRNTLERSLPPSVPNAVSHLLDHERVGKAFDRLLPRVMRRLVRNSKPVEDFVRA